MKSLLIPATILLAIVLTAGVYRNGETEGTLVSAQDLDTSANHLIDVSVNEYVGLQIQWSGADAVDATVDLECSVKSGATASAEFDSYPDANQTLAAASGSLWWDVWTRSLGTCRVVYAKGSNSAGTYSIFYRKETPPL